MKMLRTKTHDGVDIAVNPGVVQIVEKCEGEGYKTRLVLMPGRPDLFVQTPVVEVMKSLREGDSSFLLVNCTDGVDRHVNLDIVDYIVPVAKDQSVKMVGSGKVFYIYTRPGHMGLWITGVGINGTLKDKDSELARSVDRYIKSAAPIPEPEPDPVKATQAAKNLAKQHGVDLGSLKPNERGVITKMIVMDAVNAE